MEAKGSILENIFMSNLIEKFVYITYPNI